MYKTKNILKIIKLKDVTMRSSPLYDVNLNVIFNIYKLTSYRKKLWLEDCIINLKFIKFLKLLIKNNLEAIIF
jgi:hypothetical protein